MSSLHDKITKNKNELIKNILENTSFDTELLSMGNAIFDGGDGFQAYLIFQPVYKYFKMITNTNYISSWKSKGLSAESIKPFPTSDNSLTTIIDYNNYNIRVKFNGSILQQLKVIHGKIVNFYIVYEPGGSSSHNNDLTLKNCLFGLVALTKNADFDKYGYSGYGIGFDRRSSLWFPGGGFGQNVLIFGADMSSSTHIDNKKKIY